MSVLTKERRGERLVARVSGTDKQLFQRAASLEGRSVATFVIVHAREMARIEKEVGGARFAAGNYDRAAKLFSEMSKSAEFAEFLTLPASELID